MTDTNTALAGGQANEQIATIEAPTKAIDLAKGRGVQFANYSELERFSEKLAASGLCPKRYASKPGDVAVCIQMGLELGLSPMSSLQNIAVINGMPTIYGDAALALVRASGLIEIYKEEVIKDGENEEQADGPKDKFGIKVTVKRIGQEPHESVFTVKDAKAAGLWKKAGPWTQYPKRMLMFRARGFALRDVFPDVLMGFKTFEEVNDYETHQGFDNAKTVEDARAKIEAVRSAETTEENLP